ncbi:MAG: hypothetical protein LBH43_12205 [Treponema sp.]|jgi:hypothetical protein|nr:hypothetical protein [Treponema sp.]
MEVVQKLKFPNNFINLRSLTEAAVALFTAAGNDRLMEQVVLNINKLNGYVENQNDNVSHVRPLKWGALDCRR